MLFCLRFVGQTRCVLEKKLQNKIASCSKKLLVNNGGGDGDAMDVDEGPGAGAQPDGDDDAMSLSQVAVDLVEHLACPPLLVVARKCDWSVR